MKLSVVIVNYNVKHFLEQCLFSVRNACKGIDSEIYVVDNNSVDGSQAMIREKFPKVKLIANKENLGFSKANNQAIKKASGEYILLLNPDTVVEDDTFVSCIDFMDKHPEAGGLGVKMLDGKGKFLPESKRGLPTPDVAFYKIFGLSRLFPKSRIFGKYHLGYLDKDEVHEVEVLAGAFMMMRKSCLDKTGLLDEEYFMYGEDIDLSYRIMKAGFKNYYFPHTRIIHYKGESTKKHSLNYVYMFYNAMIIFARKHFSAKKARYFSFLINMAIYFRASLAIISRFLRNLFLPLFDALLMFGGVYIIKDYWEKAVIFPEGGHYPPEFMQIAVPIYIFIWIFSVFMNGGYDLPVRLIKILQGMLVGTIIILVGYALLSESYRFSRALIILGAIWGVLAIFSIRILLHILGIRKYRLGVNENRRYLIAGDSTEANRVAELIRKTYINPAFIGFAAVSEESLKKAGYIGNIHQIHDIIEIYKIDEVIFCSNDIPARKIIDNMTELQDTSVDIKFAHPESHSMIGSNSVSTTGDLYIIDINSINKNKNKRNKRFFDIFLSLFFLLTLPMNVFLVKRPFRFFLNIFAVLSGCKSWVGYHQHQYIDLSMLPEIRKGILNPADAIRIKSLSAEAIEKLNILYARDYRILNDLQIIFRGWARLGRS